MFGIVGVFRIEGDARDLMRAGRRRRVGRADGRRIGGDQLAVGVIGAHLLLALVGDDARDLARSTGWPTLATRMMVPTRLKFASGLSAFR